MIDAVKTRVRGGALRLTMAFATRKEGTAPQCHPAEQPWWFTISTPTASSGSCRKRDSSSKDDSRSTRPSLAREEDSL
jgi:hypothetical protein